MPGSTDRVNAAHGSPLQAAVLRMPIPGWARGALVGLLINVPDTIVTKSYVPIIASGVIGGAIIGAFASRLVA